MEESRSNATKESMNEDNPLLDIVINVEYHSTIATKEQPQLNFVDQCEHINKRDIDSGVMAQGVWLRGYQPLFGSLNFFLKDKGVINLFLMLSSRKLSLGLTSSFKDRHYFGYIVLTTSAGIMDHEEARRKNVGGKVLGNA
ncbi:hypothetical protein CTI12_AA145130 [Artemisia annua]|uniref:Ribosomal protein S8 n=1 Tax=Artemisia annua TaxID=35608 RepID=A0A2U1PJ88_ARTAN|nr:hypothetical protein CTI12_AA145130 [Artemisia annua]